ncbi:hypothetical protein UFOVP147_10 [uncultured Caudovirales phage]|uniref:Uncharacterized protein n=1 Tax=uncultured Caudovirales phage TaxID=2100421 RepID=A0A6J7W1S7_9CAUD|nr:hypothetical protein UFOVP147_10 [uncultured Caudovirales phage]
MTRRNGKSKWPWSIWRWTGPEESLFDLTREELSIFIQLTQQAARG